MTTYADELTAGDVMLRDFLTVAPEDTLGEVAEKMEDAELGSALVVDCGHLIGILTSRDIVRALAQRAHPSDARAREFMGSPAVSATPETPITEAAWAMVDGHFHHLPVVEDDRPVGVVGFRAVQGALEPLGVGF